MNWKLFALKAAWIIWWSSVHIGATGTCFSLVFQSLRLLHSDRFQIPIESLENCFCQEPLKKFHRTEGDYKLRHVYVWLKVFIGRTIWFVINWTLNFQRQNFRTIGFFTKVFFFFRVKRKLKQCKSHQSNKCFAHSIFSRCFYTERMSGITAKKELQETSIFVQRKKRFCFHVCFNPKLAAKQQHFHCFLAQCLMRGCQLTEVFLVSERRRDFIKIFFSCVSVCLRNRAHFTRPNNTFRGSYCSLDFSYSNVTVCRGKRLWQLARQTINCYNWDEITFIKENNIAKTSTIKWVLKHLSRVFLFLLLLQQS